MAPKKDVCSLVEFETSSDLFRVEVFANIGNETVGAATASFDENRLGPWAKLDIIEIDKDKLPARCGVGTKLYEALVAETCRRRIPLRSDTMRTSASEGFWKKQAKKGRAVCRSENRRSRRLNKDLRTMTDARGNPLRWKCDQWQLRDLCPETLERPPQPGPAANFLIPGVMAVGAGLLVTALRRRKLGLVVTNPVPGYGVVSGWGRPRPHRNGTHYGIDIPAPRGTFVLAPIAGKIVRADNVADSFAGKHVVIRQDTKLGPVHVRLMHLDRIDIFGNQYVNLGQRIGTVGSTGVVNSGPHLHLDVLVSKGVLAEFVREFGRPTPDFPAPRSIGTQVPAEALIPVTKYNDRTIADARRSGVTLRSA